MTDAITPGPVTGPVVPQKKNQTATPGSTPAAQTNNQPSSNSPDGTAGTSAAPGNVTGPVKPINKPPPPTSTQTRLPPPADSQKTNPWLSAFWLIIGALGVWAIGSASLTLVELWHEQPIIAFPVSIAALAVIVLLSRALWDEWQALRELDLLTKRQEKLQDALGKKDIKGVKTSMRLTLENLKAGGCTEVIAFEKAVAYENDCNKYLSKLDSMVLAALDRKAKDEVRNGALATAAAVAIVPHPALDAAAVLWRALVMTRRVSTIYGLRPGGLSTWKLLSHTLKSAFLAAGMGAIGGMIADGGGADGLAAALKPFAQGAVIGMRMYRLGGLCIRICRPI